jgi:hypothetical protein
MGVYRLLTEATEKSLERKTIEGLVQTIAFLFINTSLANRYAKVAYIKYMHFLSRLLAFIFSTGRQRHLENNAS